MEIEFENLSEADLIVDCIYKGGKTPKYFSRTIS